MNSQFLSLCLALALLMGCSHVEKKSQITEDRNTLIPQKTDKKIALGPEDFSSLQSDELDKYKLPSSKDSPFSHGMFGYIDPDDRDSQFQVQETVPHKVGQFYGWALKLKDSSTEKEIQINETLILPEPARVFRIDKNFSSVSEDGTTVQSQLELSPENGWIFNFWQITPGDPKGIYRFQLHDKKSTPIKEFSFQVGQ